jgi:hypothetical protein
MVAPSLDGNYHQMAKQYEENSKVKLFFNGSTVNIMNYLPRIE